MAFLGKTYTYSKGDNYEAFIASCKLPEDLQKKIVESKSSYRLEKNDDGSYTLKVISPEYNKDVRFKLGEEFDETTLNGQVAKTTFTLEGNTLTQVQKYSMGTITIKREFSDNEMKVTLTNSEWDGVAHRYFKA